MSYHITNPNDTAFPDQHLIGQGLTKREFFAAMALQGLLSDREYAIRMQYSYKAFAYRAVKLADELIKELNNNETNE